MHRLALFLALLILCEPANAASVSLEYEEPIPGLDPEPASGSAEEHAASNMSSALTRPPGRAWAWR